MVGDSYTCTCRPSYQGKHCEIYKGESFCCYTAESVVGTWAHSIYTVVPENNFAEPCSVECNATSFVVSCNKDYLPVKVYSQILWTRQPEPVSKCTCQFYHWSSGHNRYRRRRRPCVIPYEGCGTKMQVRHSTFQDYFENRVITLKCRFKPDGVGGLGCFGKRIRHTEVEVATNQYFCLFDVLV